MGEEAQEAPHSTHRWCDTAPLARGSAPRTKDRSSPARLQDQSSFLLRERLLRAAELTVKGSSFRQGGILASSNGTRDWLSVAAHLLVRLSPSRRDSDLVYMKLEKSQLKGRGEPERDRMIRVHIHPSPGNRGQEGLARRRSMVGRWGCLCGSHGKQQEATGRGPATASTAKRPGSSALCQGLGGLSPVRALIAPGECRDRGEGLRGGEARGSIGHGRCGPIETVESACSGKQVNF